MLDTLMMCPRLRSIIPLESSLVRSTYMLLHAVMQNIVGLISSSAILEQRHIQQVLCWPCICST